jgi:hypothetical protein
MPEPVHPAVVTRRRKPRATPAATFLDSVAVAIEQLWKAALEFILQGCRHRQYGVPKVLFLDNKYI